MTHPLEDKFLDYLEGALSPEEREHFESALKADTALQSSLEAYRKVINTETRLRALEPSLGPNFVVKVMDRVEEERARSWSRLLAGFTGRGRYITAALATLATAAVALKLGVDIPQDMIKRPRLAAPEAVVVREEPASPTDAAPISQDRVNAGAGQRPAIFQKETQPAEDRRSRAVQELPEEEAAYPRQPPAATRSITREQSAQNKPSAAVQVPNGYRVVTVSGVEGWAADGSKVDVIWRSVIAGKPAMTTIVRNAKVLSAERAAPAGAPGNAPAPSQITLLVSATDAKKITLAQTTGSLSLSLQGDTDVGKAESAQGSVTVDDLLGRSTRANGRGHRSPAEAVSGGRTLPEKTGRLPDDRDSANSSSRPNIPAGKGTVIIGGQKWLIGEGGELVSDRKTDGKAKSAAARPQEAPAPLPHSRAPEGASDLQGSAAARRASEGRADDEAAETRSLNAPKLYERRADKEQAEFSYSGPSKLAEQKAQSLQDGALRTVSIGVFVDTRLLARVVPGARVSVVWTRRGPSGQTASEMLTQNATVTAPPQRTDAFRGAGEPADLIRVTVSLRVLSADAQRIMAASTSGRFTLQLP
jgi:Flp pilus assembly protein CpaB